MTTCEMRIHLPVLSLHDAPMRYAIEWSSLPSHKSTVQFDELMCFVGMQGRIFMGGDCGWEDEKLKVLHLRMCPDKVMLVELHH